MIVHYSFTIVHLKNAINMCILWGPVKETTRNLLSVRNGWGLSWLAGKLV